jgi:hypothetical protein
MKSTRNTTGHTRYFGLGCKKKTIFIYIKSFLRSSKLINTCHINDTKFKFMIKQEVLGRSYESFFPSNASIGIAW